MNITKKEIFIVLILICVAIVRFVFFVPSAPDYKNVIGQKVIVEGVVIALPDVRANNQRITFQPTNSKTNIIAIVDRNIEINYGDLIKVIGHLESPENFTTNNGREFDYVEYLAHRDIYFLIPYAEIEVLSHNNGSFIKKYLFKLNSSFIKNIQYVIPAPESDLADGLLLGARRGFDNETKEEFITTGTIHIVALSGYNISIVAKAIMYIASSFFGLATSSILGVIIIILFVLMSGAGASSVRAGVMAVIALLGRMSGRTYSASRALIIAGLLMIAFDLRVIFDISFQLSFLATFGILFITPKVIKWVMWMPARFGLREIAATTIAAQIAVLPLLLYTTGVFSFVAFPANVLILVFIPIAMLLSFIAGLLVFLSPSIALPFGYLAYVPLTYILKTIHLFAILPFASVTIKSFPLIFTIILYMFLFYWVFVLKTKKDLSV